MPPPPTPSPNTPRPPPGAEDRLRHSPPPTLGSVETVRVGQNSAPLDATLKAGAPAPDVAEEVVGESAARPQDRFGKFLRDRRLGAGGMGEVWKAWDTELRRWVALKFLISGDPDELARFQGEARTAGSLIHPNIASVYEVGSAHDRHFIAMQYVDGRTLKAFPRGDRHALARLMRDAARAVAFAHERGIVHRDLKPDNMMVVTRERGSTTGGSSVLQGDAWEHHLYVMDFGLAKSVDGARSLSGAVVGTPSYMPPEQSRGRPVDATADVYALGATLYELLANRPPFTGESVYEILRKVQEDDPRAPRRIDPEIDADLETIVLKCLEKDPARRYPSAAALADDLDRWLLDEPIAAHPPSVFYQARKFVVRRRGIVATATLAGLVIASLAAAFVPRWLADREAGRKAEELREAEAARNRKREAALLRLSTLWSTIVERKTEQRRLLTAPAEAWRALEGAVTALDGYIAEWPDEPQGYYVRARGRLYLSDLAAAEADLQRAVEIAPEFRQGWSLLGSVRYERYFRATYGVVEEVERKREAAQPILDSALQAFERGREGAPGDAARWGLPWTRDDEIGRTMAEAVQARADEARMTGILTGAFGRFRSEEYARLMGNWGPLEERPAWFGKALEIAPGYGDAWADRGYMFSLAGDLQSALSDYSRAIDVSIERNQPWFQRGVVRERLGDTRGALEDVERALEITPGRVDALYNRARLRGMLGNLDGAIDDYVQVTGLDPGHFRALYNCGILRRDRGDLAESDADFTAALRLRPGDAGTLENRAMTRRLLRRWDDAIADCDLVLAGAPGNPFALYTRGLAKRGKKDYAGAAVDLVRAAVASPNNYDAAVKGAEAAAEAGDFTAPLALYDRALAERPGDANLLHHRGQLKKFAGDFRGAVADYDAALAIAPRFVDAYIGRGIARKRLDDFAGAVQDYDAALALDPGNVQAFANRGAARRLLRDDDGAMDDFNAVLQQAPKHGFALRERARLLRRRGDLKGALSDLNLAVRLDPGDLSLLVQRGAVRHDLGDTAGAQADIDAVLAKEPRDIPALVCRGDFRLLAGDLDGAEADYADVLARDPEDTPALCGRGRARLARGDRAGAVDDFRRVLEVAPETSDSYLLAKTQLKELGE